jgi:hypothetical protein
MNWKGCGRKDPRLFLRYSQALAWSCCGKWRRNTARRFGVPLRDLNRVPQEEEIINFNSGALPRSISQEDSNLASNEVDTKLTGERLSGPLFRKPTDVSSHRIYTIRKKKLALCLTNLCHAMKKYGGSGCINLRILDLATSWGWVVNFSPLPLITGQRAPSIHWKGGWLGPGTGLDDVEKRKTLSPPGLNSEPTASR